MANEQSKRDDNRVPALLVHDSTGAETRKVKQTTNGGIPVEFVSGASSTASTFDHGGNSDVDTAAEQIVATSVVATHGVIVKAHRDNTGIIYIGNSDVTAATADATDGFPIEAGEAVTIEIDNANKLYAIASAVNQKLYWLAI